MHTCTHIYLYTYIHTYINTCILYYLTNKVFYWYGLLGKALPFSWPHNSTWRVFPQSNTAGLSHHSHGRKLTECWTGRRNYSSSVWHLPCLEPSFLKNSCFDSCPCSSDRGRLSILSSSWISLSIGSKLMRETLIRLLMCSLEINILKLFLLLF